MADKPKTLVIAERYCSISYAVQIVQCGLLYLILALLSSQLVLGDSLAELSVFLPSALVLSIVVISRAYRLWPAVVLGQLLFGIFSAYTLTLTIGLALVSGLALLLAAALSRYWVVGFKLTLLRDLARFLILIFLIYQPVIATFGTFVLWLDNHFATTSSAISVWLSWWSGHGLAQLLITPLLLAMLLGQNTLKKLKAAQLPLLLFIVAALGMALSAVSHDIFEGVLILILVPLMVWVAFCGRIPAVSVAASLFFIIFVIATRFGYGPLSMVEVSVFGLLTLLAAGLLVLGLFLSVLFEQLSQSQLRFSQLIQASPVPMLVNDSEQNIVFVNRAFTEVLGYTNDELKNMQQFYKLIIRSELVDGLQEPKIRCRDGCERSFVLSVTALQGDSLGAYLMVLFDVTEQKEIEQDLRIAAAAFEAREGMIVTDSHGLILRVNQAFTHITGYAPEEVVGYNPRIFSSGKQDATFYKKMWQGLREKGVWEGEIWNKRKNGDIFPEYLVITEVRNEYGGISNYVGTFSDITERKAAAEEIQYLAYYDLLTGLPNRRLITDRLKQALAASVRNQQRGALLFIDLDHFKTLNDTLGHDVGDLLLAQVAKRIKRCTRENDTIARLGGDEFVVMLEGLDVEEVEACKQVKVVALKILKVFVTPFELNGYEYRTTPSIGATTFVSQDLTPEDVLKQADIAMYQAKKAGRNALRFFDPQMQANLSARAEMEYNMHHALAREQFQLYYQPQVDCMGRVVGAEALLRWYIPDQGFISPAVFIPLAEDIGMILPIGAWVLETACAQIHAWQQYAETQKIVLSVNVSAKQFRQPDFVGQISDLVSKYQISSGLLKLELTESILLDNVEDVVLAMQEISDLGVAFSLDDFGTGYSSLQYLKRLKLDELKIDQSFTRDIFTDHSDRSIITTIIAMARNLDLMVIAEGVETEEQRKFLQENGCEHFQGYFFSRPIPIDQFMDLLQTNETLPAKVKNA